MYARKNLQLICHLKIFLKFSYKYFTNRRSCYMLNTRKSSFMSFVDWLSEPFCLYTKDYARV